MQACSTARNVSVPTLDPRETAMSLSAHMDVQEIAPSTCVEGLGTSTSSTLMHTRLQLMILDVEAPRRTPTTKSGMQTWVTVALWHNVDEWQFSKYTF